MIHQGVTCLIPEVKLKSCRVSSHLKKRPELVISMHAQLTAGKNIAKGRTSKNTSSLRFQAMVGLSSTKGVGLRCMYKRVGLEKGCGYTKGVW